MRYFHLVLLLAFGLAANAAVIPTDRTITWQGNVGVQGGIPARTTIFATLPAGSSLAAVQNALDNCPANQVVKLSAGSYAWNGTLDWQGVNDGVVLRGAGPANTIVTFSSGYIYMRNYYNESSLSTEANLSVDAIKGGNTLTLAAVPAWVTVGDTILIDQLDDPALVGGVGTSGGSSYREVTGNGQRGLAQLDRVTAKTATTITVELPLFYGWKTARSAQIVQGGHNPTNDHGRYQCGIEGMKLIADFSYTDVHMIKMENCDSCWIKDVESENIAGGAHVWTAFCYRCEVRDSDFHGAHLFGGGQAYGVALYHVSTGCLVENNIFGELHNAMTANYGCSGNVFAYNYEADGKSDARQNAGNNTHGVHCYMNIWEGNYCEDKVLADWTHGSSSHNTVFRSRIAGNNGTNSDERTCVSIEYYNRYWNVVGNVLGTAGLQNKYMSNSSSPASGSNGNIFKLGGEVNINDDYSPSDAASFTSGSFVLVHGNYDTVTNGITWESAVADHNLPVSYYLTSKPAWFGDRPWPPFDPASPSTALATNIPAGYRHIYGMDPPAGGTGNQAPVASAASATTLEDTAKAITLAASDANGNALTYAIVASPSHGTLTGSGASRTYMPAANYNGADSFTFKANDGTVDSNTAMISLTVTAANDAPVANAQAITTAQNTSKAITLSGSDVEGGVLTFAIVANPAHGALSGSGASRTYTPTPSYTGTDSFTFTVGDGTASSSAATVAITVSASTSTNLAPTVSAATASPSPVTTTTASLAATASDDGGETALTYTWSATGPATVVFSPNGSNAAKTSTATFTKAGSYTLTVAAKDVGNLSSAKSVTVTVQATPSTLSISPTGASVQPGMTVDFNAVVSDQFNVALANQPAPVWTVSGGGTIAASGLFTAGAGTPSPSGGVSATTYVVTATAGTAGSTALVTVSTASTALADGGGTGRRCGGGSALALIAGLGLMLVRRRRG